MATSNALPGGPVPAEDSHVDTRAARRSTLIYFACQMAVLAIALTALLGLYRRDLSVPFVAEGDALHHVMSAKMMIDGGGWWRTDRLSAPFGLDMRPFPVDGTMDYLLLRLCTLFTGQPGLAVNVCWLLTIFLTAIIATYCLTVLRISPLVAMAVGLLYALTPRTFYSNLIQFPLTIYLLPPVMTTAVLVLSRRWTGLARRTQITLLCGCFLGGLNYTYHSFFSAIVLCAAGSLAVLRFRRIEAARVAAVATGLLVLAATLHLAPTLWAWHKDPATQRVVAHMKNIQDADMYGLKLRHLITPVEDHFLPALRHAEEAIIGVGWPYENENTNARLGLIGAAGLVLLLLTLLVPGGAWHGADGATIRSLSSLNLVMILLGVFGGFGTVWNVFVSSDIRAYNRVSNYIAFFCLAAVGVMLTRLLAGVKATRKGTSVGGVVGIAALLLFGIADQNAAKPLKEGYAYQALNYRAAAELVAQLETRFAAGSAIYQLPYVEYPYPATTPIYEMKICDPLLPYAHSRHLRWSFPALSAEATAWNRGVSSLPPEKLVDYLVGAGFAGIWVDRYGYPDKGDRIETGLAGVLSVPPMVSSNGRYAVFSLAAVKEKMFQGKSAAETAAVMRDRRQGPLYRWGEPLSFVENPALPPLTWFLGAGWGPQAVGYRWTYGKDATMGFRVQPTSDDQTLVMKVCQFLPYKRMPVIVKVDGTRIGEWNVVGGVTFSMRIPGSVLAGKAKFALILETPAATTPRSLIGASDDRVLGLAVRGLQIGNPGSGASIVDREQGEIYRWGDAVFFDEKHVSALLPFLRTGWCEQEAGYRWTDGKEAKLEFRVQPTTANQTLSMKVSQFLPYKRMPVIVKVDGTRVGEWNAVGGETFSMTIPGSVLSGKEKFTLALEMPEATSPLALGTANDGRILGLAMREIRIGN